MATTTTTYTSVEFAAYIEIQKLVWEAIELEHLSEKQMSELKEYIWSLAPQITIPTFGGVIGKVEFEIGTYDGKGWVDGENGEDDEALDGTDWDIFGLVQYLYEKYDMCDEVDDWKLTITTN